MHAVLTVGHRPGDLVSSLRTVLPAENRQCLARSLVFGQDPGWQQLVLFATETPQWRLVLCAGGANEIELTIEPVQGGLKLACEAVWRTVQNAGRPMKLKPKLVTLIVVDEGTTHVISQAKVGFVPQGRRTEFWLPLGVGVATGVALLITNATQDEVWSAVPGFLGAVFSLGVLLLDAARKKLVWFE